MMRTAHLRPDRSGTSGVSGQPRRLAAGIALAGLLLGGCALTPSTPTVTYDLGPPAGAAPGATPCPGCAWRKPTAPPGWTATRSSIACTTPRPSACSPMPPSAG
ncbi:hypothetical protein ACU4GD_09235 [Cupriavidus basilensis]